MSDSMDMLRRFEEYARKLGVDPVDDPIAWGSAQAVIISLTHSLPGVEVRIYSERELFDALLGARSWQ